MVRSVMVTMAESGEDDGVDKLGRPSWAWPAIRVTAEEEEAWAELEARLRLRGSVKGGK